MAISIRDARGVQPLVAATGTPVIVPDAPETQPETEHSVAVTDSREAAAELLLKDLDPPTADFAREVAYLHARIPLWAVIVGAVQRCYEDATLIAPVLPPMVRRMTDGFVPPGTRGDSFCEICGKSFSAKRLRQRNCGSEECGKEMQRRDIEAAQQKQNARMHQYDAVNDTVVRGSGLRPEPLAEPSPG
jgi:hypothetical protein